MKIAEWYKDKRRSKEILAGLEMIIVDEIYEYNHELDLEAQQQHLDKIRELTELRDRFKETRKMGQLSWDTVIKTGGTAIMAYLVLRHEASGDIITTKAWDIVKRG